VLVTDYRTATPFDSIENTQEYFRLLADILSQAKLEIEGDIRMEAQSGASRRLDTLRLVLFKLHKLEEHVTGSGRLLNDLRTLRRLLLKERVQSAESKSK
jgi:hypothetical protein